MAKILDEINEDVEEYIYLHLANKDNQENIKRLLEMYLKEYSVIALEDKGIRGVLLYVKESCQIVLIFFEEEIIAKQLLDHLVDIAKKKNIAKISANVTEDKVNIFEAYGFLKEEREEEQPFDQMDYFLQNDQLGKSVTVIVDHPYGSFHPHRPDVQYPLNYGYILSINEDEELQDAYVYGPKEPIEEFQGVVVGIVYHKDDYRSRFIVASPLEVIKQEDILQAIGFEEQYYDTRIIFKEDMKWKK